MKKVLFVTYYFPPSGGSGVQRVVKFIKYLPQFSWRPVVYTVKNGEYPVTDESLNNDIPEDITILRRRIWEPYNLYRVFTRQSKSSKISPGFLSEKPKHGLSQKIAKWIRGNLFIPDARRYWIKPSVKFLAKYLKQNPVDAVISSGPPHSVHLIALELKLKLNIPWIADFRDPWTNIYFFKRLSLSRYALNRHRELEKKVLDNADYITVVGETMKSDFKSQTFKPVEVITNGFDEDDMKNTVTQLDEKFSLVYTGYLLPDENPDILWRVISDMIKNVDRFGCDLEIKLAGKTDVNVIERIKHFELDKFVKIIPYQPHNIITQFQQSAQVLLLLLNDTPEFRRVLTGKFFEYLAARRPIIAIGSVSGDAAEIIRQTCSGFVFSGTDYEKLREKLLDFYYHYKQKNLKINSINIGQFTRKNLTKKLAEILNNITYGKN